MAPHRVAGRDRSAAAPAGPTFRCLRGTRREGSAVGGVDHQETPLDVGHHHGGPGVDGGAGEQGHRVPLLAAGEDGARLVTVGDRLPHHRRLADHPRHPVQHRPLRFRRRVRAPPVRPPAPVISTIRPPPGSHSVPPDPFGTRLRFGIPWPMTGPAPAPPPLDPLTARKTCRTVEPLHGMIYFAPEATESYTRLGLPSEAGYFASRSAAMGAVGADTVIATFFNFHPGLVRQAIPSAWEAAPPAAVLGARLDAADAALRRMLGPAVDSAEMAKAAGLARSAAERAALDATQGRPLFAAHAGLPWPDSPHLVLWHAQTLLREFRGDGHIAWLVDHDLDPVEALGLHLATGDLPEGFLRATRGWPDDEWEAGVNRLVARGLVARVEPSDAHRASLALTEGGAALRQRIEEETDRSAVHAYEAVGEAGCAELRALARPFSRAVVDAAGFGF